MKTTWAALIALGANVVRAAPDVDTRFPYTGPAVPVGDFADPSINGNGAGFPRLVEPPAVQPATSNPTNNVNVISLSYLPNGINIHYQTPFGLGEAPSVKWGTDPSNLASTASGNTHTYDRTPPCSLVSVTQCSQFFHEIALVNLQPGTTYYYQILPANGTTESDVLSFNTARASGDNSKFSIAVLNDMGYTNAAGTQKYLVEAATDSDPIAFAWHGGDISYADDWYSGILPCEDDWPVCYNGTSTELPGSGPIPAEYDVPLPSGEVANQGGPQGGDMSVLYESNWDLWQQWINSITTKIPYMVLPGNHEASCAEFDGPGNVLTALLNFNQTNSTAAKSGLTYYSCPVSQRNFTAYQHRFHMPGDETGGVGNFWYSFDYGLAHFVSIDGETDFPYSPEWPFARDTKAGETLPTESQTFVTDSGPFGTIDGSITVAENYQQWQWLKEDLASVDRTKTPWVFVMSHRPMYSSQSATYQSDVRKAFEPLLLQYGVDAYFSGHIHWYERLWPMSSNGVIDTASVIDNHTYSVNEGNSITHIINGMAGNIESHSVLDPGETPANITAYLDQENYGFSKLTVFNETAAYWEFVRGVDGSIGDYVWLVKPTNTTTSSSSSVASGTSTGVPSSSATVASVNATSSFVSSAASSAASSAHTFSSSLTINTSSGATSAASSGTTSAASSVATSGATSSGVTSGVSSASASFGITNSTSGLTSGASSASASFVITNSTSGVTSTASSTSGAVSSSAPVTSAPSTSPTSGVTEAELLNDLAAIAAAVDQLLTALAGLPASVGDVLNAFGALESANGKFFSDLASFAGVSASLRKRAVDGPFGPFISQIAVNATEQQAIALNALASAHDDIVSADIVSGTVSSGTSLANVGTQLLTTYDLTCFAGDLNAAITAFNTAYGTSITLVSEAATCPISSASATGTGTGASTGAGVTSTAASFIFSTGTVTSTIGTSTVTFLTTEIISTCPCENEKTKSSAESFTTVTSETTITVPCSTVEGTTFFSTITEAITLTVPCPSTEASATETAAATGAPAASGETEAPAPGETEAPATPGEAEASAAPGETEAPVAPSETEAPAAPGETEAPAASAPAAETTGQTAPEQASSASRLLGISAVFAVVLNAFVLLV